MISWINGDLVDIWQTNQKFFVLLNCQGLGYQIQILESFFLKLKTNQISNKNITLWIKHIKKEDSDLLFGFTSKDQKNFFIEILSIRGVGSQIGMGILNNFYNPLGPLLIKKTIKDNPIHPLYCSDYSILKDLKTI